MFDILLYGSSREVVLGCHLSCAVARFGNHKNCAEDDEINRVGRKSKHRQERHEVAGDLKPHADNCNDRHRALVSEA